MGPGSGEGDDDADPPQEGGAGSQNAPQGVQLRVGRRGQHEEVAGEETKATHIIWVCQPLVVVVGGGGVKQGSVSVSAVGDLVG